MNTIKEFIDWVRNHPGVERDEDGLYLSLDDGWTIEFEVEEDGLVSSLDITRWDCHVLDSIIHQVADVEEFIFVHWADYNGDDSNTTKVLGVIQTSDSVDDIVDVNDPVAPESVRDFINWLKSL